MFGSANTQKCNRLFQGGALAQGGFQGFGQVEEFRLYLTKNSGSHPRNAATSSLQ